MDTPPTRWEVLVRWTRAAQLVADLVSDPDFLAAMQDEEITEEELQRRYGVSDVSTILQECATDLGIAASGSTSPTFASSFWAR